MATRHVTGVIRDDHGRTVALTNAAESWSPVAAAHAARQIEAQLHTYVATSGASQARISVVEGPHGPYLRTKADATSPDNLDALPEVVDHPLTGSFDLVMEVSQATLQTALTAMHASNAIAHRATVIAGSDVVVLQLGAPTIALTETVAGAAASCRVETPLIAWLRRADSAADAGYTASGVVAAPAACFAVTEADDSFTLDTDWSGVSAADVTLNGAAPAAVQDRIRAAVLSWAQEAGGGRYPLPSVAALGAPHGANLRFPHAGAGVACQVGVNGEAPLEPASWPAPSGSPLRVTLSGRWVAARVMEELRSAWGALPPPYGQGFVDLGGGTRLTALDVDLGDRALLFTGRLSKSLISASFTATIRLSGGTPGSLKASSVGAVGGVGADDDGVAVDVTDLLGSVTNFLSGGALQRALTDGIRAALAKDSGGLAGLLSRPTVRATAGARSAASVKLDPQITSTTVTAFGVTVEGALSAAPAPAPVAQLDVIDLGGSWRLLSLMSSWAPGDHIATVAFEFGDGLRVSLTAATLALAVPHEYATGPYTARATITDQAGRMASAATPFRVA